jgi:hypothetical protein
MKRFFAVFTLLVAFAVAGLAAPTPSFAIGSGSGGTIPSFDDPEPAPTETEPEEAEPTTTPAPTTQETGEEQLEQEAALQNTNQAETGSTGCSADTWECTDFSACTPDGEQQRSCTLAVDCPGVDTLSPDTIQPCDHLQCDQETLRERVYCRLNLSPEGIRREFEIEYLPEECRTVTNIDARQECVDRYRAYNACWQMSTATDRFTCARQVLEMPTDVSIEAQRCESLTGDLHDQCVRRLQQQVYNLIKFKFYDLEWRAEYLASEGLIDIDTLTGFIVLIVESKTAFNETGSTSQRRAIIQDVRQGWEDFLMAVREY